MATAQTKQPEMLTITEIAKSLRVSPCTVHLWIANGHLEATNVTAVGGRTRWRVASADLKRFLESRRSRTPKHPFGKARRRYEMPIIKEWIDQ